MGVNNGASRRFRLIVRYPAEVFSQCICIRSRNEIEGMERMSFDRRCGVSKDVGEKRRYLITIQLDAVDDPRRAHLSLAPSKLGDVIPMAAI